MRADDNSIIVSERRYRMVADISNFDGERIFRKFFGQHGREQSGVVFAVGEYQ